MDGLALAGLFVAVLAIVAGQYFEGGQLATLLNGSAFLIVLGGTVGATMLQTPIQHFVRAFKMLPWVFLPPELPMAVTLDKIARWSRVARSSGLLGLEPMVDEEPEYFANKGLGLVVDGHEPEDVRAILQVDMELEEHLYLQSAKVFESMGGYAPTLGIIGAVMGLIHVMGHLTEPDKLGAGIATAFVATIYGICFANLFFLPVANKLKAVIARQSQYREMLIEGLVSIAEGQNPRVIETKLSAYLEH